MTSVPGAAAPLCWTHAARSIRFGLSAPDFDTVREGLRQRCRTREGNVDRRAGDSAGTVSTEIRRPPRLLRCALRPLRLSTLMPTLLSALLVLAACGDAADAPATDGAPSAETGGFDPITLAVDPRVDALLSGYASDTAPGLAVMVIRDGEVLHANGYGVADMESRRPITTETPFRLASVSKQMVAFVTVMLEERGLLGFDDPVTTWVPEAGRFEGVTVRHLLNHTSGLPDYYGFPSLGAAADSAHSATTPDGEGVFANADAAAFYETEGEFEFEPGTRYAYSNPGYELLALITARVTGERFADFIDRELFDPIGMETAQVRASPTTTILGRAIGYSADSTGTWNENDDHPFNWMIGAGGIYASLEDMYRWDQALWRWADEGDRLEASFTPPELPGDSISTYGFGWGIREDPPRVMHSGGWVGFVTHIVRYLDDRLTVVVLSNASLGSPGIAAQVAELYRGAPRTPTQR